VAEGGGIRTVGPSRGEALELSRRKTGRGSICHGDLRFEPPPSASEISAMTLSTRRRAAESDEPFAPIADRGKHPANFPSLSKSIAGNYGCNSLSESFTDEGTLINEIRIFPTLLLLFAIPRSAWADFTAAEAAERHDALRARGASHIKGNWNPDGKQRSRQFGVL
jgi:hypothetical protein